MSSDIVTMARQPVAWKSCLVVVVIGCIVMWWSGAFHAPVEKVRSLHGLSEVAVIAKLGQPDSTDEFTMDQPLGEFHVELYNTYPPNSRGNQDIGIRVHTWNYVRHKVTVWLHKPDDQWIVLDTCRWKNGVEF